MVDGDTSKLTPSGDTSKLTRFSEMGTHDTQQATQTKSITKTTYASVLAGQQLIVDSDPEQVSSPSSSTLTDPNAITFKPYALYKGKPSIEFSEAESNQLVGKLKYVLVGKFSHGRPNIVEIKAFFSTLKFRGCINFSIYDNKHIYIECSSFFDYARIWLKLVWSIKGYSMRVFKWNPDFHPSKESTIVPVWIRIEGLPLHMFDEMPLLQVANTIGKPIKVDQRNVNRTILNSARICIELDLSKPLVDMIWVSFEKGKLGDVLEGIWARVFYDELPSFCPDFCHLGHSMEQCKVRKGKGLLHDEPVLKHELASKDRTDLCEIAANNSKHSSLSNLLKPCSSVWIEKKEKRRAKTQDKNKTKDPTSQNQFDALVHHTTLEDSGVAVTCNEPKENVSDLMRCSEIEKMQSATVIKPHFRQISKIGGAHTQSLADQDSQSGATDVLYKNASSELTVGYKEDVEQNVFEQQQEDMNSVHETLTDQILDVEKEQVATSFKDGILSDQQEIKMSHNPGGTIEGKETVIKQTWAEEVESDIVNHTHETSNNGLQQEAGYNKHEAMSEQVMEHLDHQGQRTTPDLVGIDTLVDTKNDKTSGRLEKTRGTKLALNPKATSYFSYPPSMIEQNVSNSGQAVRVAGAEQGSKNGVTDQNNLRTEAKEPTSKHTKRGIQTVQTGGVALEDYFEIITGKDWINKRKLTTLPMPNFENMTKEQQKRQAAQILAFIYTSRINIDIERAVKNDIVKEGKATIFVQPGVIDIEAENQDTTNKEWKIVTKKKSKGKKESGLEAEQQSCNRNTNTMRMDFLMAHINKMKRDSPAKRKLIAEFKDLKGYKSS